MEGSEDVLPLETLPDEKVSWPPNDEFCLTEGDHDKLKSSTRCFEASNKVEIKTREFKDHKERVSSSSDKSITWTVVNEVSNDNLSQSQTNDDNLFKS